MASCKAVFENIKLAAGAIPAHAWTVAMHTYHSFFGRWSPHAVLSAFHISKEHETQSISQGHDTNKDKVEIPIACW